MTKSLMTFIAYPKIVADLGGAEYVRYNARRVVVKLPTKTDEVTLKRSSLPDPEQWTAFNLADAVNKLTT